MSNTQKEEMEMAKKGNAAKSVKRAAKPRRLKDLPAKNAKGVKGGAILRRKAY